MALNFRIGYAKNSDQGSNDQLSKYTNKRKSGTKGEEKAEKNEMKFKSKSIAFIVQRTISPPTQCQNDFTFYLLVDAAIGYHAKPPPPPVCKRIKVRIYCSHFAVHFLYSQHDVIDTNGIFIANRGSSDKNVNFNLSFHLKESNNLFECKLYRLLRVKVMSKVNSKVNG